MNLIWKNAPSHLYDIVEKFQHVFIDQERDKLDQVFSSDFGIHNGMSSLQYAEYEFNEFSTKCKKFNLTKDSNARACDLDNNFFYFSLGNKEDPAVFEAIFKFDKNQKKLQGNQYSFKIEPKMQFIKRNNNIQSIRRVNLKSVDDKRVKQIVVGLTADDFTFIKNEMPEHLGGNFYSLVYELENEDNLTKWDKIKVVTDKGVFSEKILMRAKDHILFQDNLFPIIEGNTVYCQENVYPVVVSVVLEDNSEHFFKYPEEKIWSFNKNIKRVCLTDTLSFDWIVEV